MLPRSVFLLLALAAASPSQARVALIDDLAGRSGLRAGQVRMLLAPAPGAHPGWRDYARLERRMIDAIGADAWRALRRGDEVKSLPRATLAQRAD